MFVPHIILQRNIIYITMCISQDQQIIIIRMVKITLACRLQYVVLVFLKRKYPTKYQQRTDASVRAGFQVAVTGAEVVGAAHACVLQSFSSSGDPGQGMSVEEQSLFLFMSPPPHCLLHTVHGPHLLHSEYPVSSIM